MCQNVKKKLLYGQHPFGQQFQKRKEVITQF